MTSDRQLKFWYDRYNKAYFDGKLSEHTVLFWEPPSDAQAETCPIFEVDHGQFFIKLDPAMKGFPDFWKLVLLHEMIHVKLWPKHPKHQHGKLFEDEKLRLVLAGALKKIW